MICRVEYKLCAMVLEEIRTLMMQFVGEAKEVSMKKID